MMPRKIPALAEGGASSRPTVQDSGEGDAEIALDLEYRSRLRGPQPKSSKPVTASFLPAVDSDGDEIVGEISVGIAPPSPDATIIAPPLPEPSGGAQGGPVDVDSRDQEIRELVRERHRLLCQLNSARLDATSAESALSRAQERIECQQAQLLGDRARQLEREQAERGRNNDVVPRRARTPSPSRSPASEIRLPRGDGAGNQRVRSISTPPPVGRLPRPRGPTAWGVPRSRFSKPLVNPDRWDGSTPLAPFVKHFNLCAEVNSWDDTTKAHFFAISLKGRAQRALGCLTAAQTRSFRHMIAAIRGQFEPEGREELHRAQLASRVRGPKETLQEIAQDIRDQAERAFPDLDEVGRDSMAKHYFISALDVDTRLRVLQMRPSDLQTALQDSIELEAIARAEKERPKPSGATGGATTRVRQVAMNPSPDEAIRAVQPGPVVTVTQADVIVELTAQVKKQGEQMARRSAEEDRRGRAVTEALNAAIHCIQQLTPANTGARGGPQPNHAPPRPFLNTNRGPPARGGADGPPRGQPRMQDTRAGNPRQPTPAVNRGASGTDRRPERLCFACGMPGHFAAECPTNSTPSWSGN